MCSFRANGHEWHLLVENAAPAKINGTGGLGYTRITSRFPSG